MEKSDNKSKLDDRSSVIMAIAEGRRQTVALAYLDLNVPCKMYVTSFSETSTRFPSTCFTVARVNPGIILMGPWSFHSGSDRKGSSLFKRLYRTFDDETSETTFHEAATRFFNDVEGYGIYSKISQKESFDFEIRNKYLILSSLCCLVKYAEHMEASNFGKESVQIEEVAPDGRLLMNRSTCINLEIVSNKRNGSKSFSLVDLFRPSTSIGKRLLRSTLMSPLTDLTTIEQRHVSTNALVNFHYNTNMFEYIGCSGNPVV